MVWKKVACAKEYVKGICPKNYTVFDQTANTWNNYRCRTLTSMKDGYFKNEVDETIEDFKSIRRGNKLCRYVTNNEGAACLLKYGDSGNHEEFIKDGTKCPVLVTIESPSGKKPKFPYIVYEGVCYIPPME